MFKTIKSIRTNSISCQPIEVQSTDGGRVLTVEANGEMYPFGILGDKDSEFFRVVTASAWNGGGIPDSVELLDPKSNNFARELEPVSFPGIIEAVLARGLHAMMEIASQIWLADNDERMPSKAYDFLRRLLLAGQGLGVEVTSAAAINPGCRGLVVYVPGPLWEEQGVGISLDESGELRFTECGEQSASGDLFNLCLLVAGRSLEAWTVQFDAEDGFRMVRGKLADGILDRLVTADTAAALVAGLEDACPKVSGSWKYSDPRVALCPKHDGLHLAQYMQRHLGVECTCSC